MPFEQFATYREIKSPTEVWAQAWDITNGAALPNAADCEIFHFLEFRRGPMSMGSQSKVAIGLLTVVVRLDS